MRTFGISLYLILLSAVMLLALLACKAYFL